MVIIGYNLLIEMKPNQTDNRLNSHKRSDTKMERERTNYIKNITLTTKMGRFFT